MVFPFLLCSFLISLVSAADNALSSTSLQQSLYGDLEQSCGSFPTLRLLDLQITLTELYQHNHHEPLWQDAQRLTALKVQLEQLVDDGLQPNDYPFALQATHSDNDCAELLISSEYLLALEHLSHGRFVQSDYELLWQASGLPTASLPALSEIALTGLNEDISAAFDKARPGLPQYRALRSAFAKMNKDPSPRPPITSGPLIRPGMSDARIEQIAMQMHQDGFLLDAYDAKDIQRWLYDETLEQAVRLFQANHGIQSDGIIGPQTIKAMNISPLQRLQQVQINLERLRWINALRSDSLLLINIASGHLQLIRGNELLWQARAQTGRPNRPTPPIVSYINRITLNPSWTVPPTILRNDVLPQIRHNPDYLDAHNMQALDAEGKRLDPQQIDWNSPKGIILRQPPGPNNPLGKIVFRLPNPFSIYLHDTPNKHLFEQANRNVSSGCVRVEDANGLASHLFTSLSSLERERIAQKLASGQTHEIALSNGPQVILAYWTSFIDMEGKLAFSTDSYGRDQPLVDALAILPSEQNLDITQPESGCAFFDNSALNAGQ